MTTSDKELLELAAKAAGIDKTLESEWLTFRGESFRRFIKEKYFDKTLGYVREVYWSPLTDDCDALRLAVDLKMDVCIHKTWVGVTCVGVSEEIAKDKYAATRRAIVRAAAAIGESM